jgi:hypothetical protein
LPRSEAAFPEHENAQSERRERERVCVCVHAWNEVGKSGATVFGVGRQEQEMSSGTAGSWVIGWSIGQKHASRVKEK